MDTMPKANPEVHTLKGQEKRKKNEKIRDKNFLKQAQRLVQEIEYLKAKRDAYLAIIVADFGMKVPQNLWEQFKPFTGVRHLEKEAGKLRKHVSPETVGEYLGAWGARQIMRITGRDASINQQDVLLLKSYRSWLLSRVGQGGGNNPAGIEMRLADALTAEFDLRPTDVKKLRPEASQLEKRKALARELLRGIKVERRQIKTEPPKTTHEKPQAKEKGRALRESEPQSPDKAAQKALISNGRFIIEDGATVNNIRQAIAKFLSKDKSLEHVRGAKK